MSAKSLFLSIADDAASMSLGGSAYEPPDIEVVQMGVKGIFAALAAGNESDDANNHSPARANGLNIFTISACDVNDIFASFSNYGNPKTSGYVKSDPDGNPDPIIHN